MRKGSSMCTGGLANLINGLPNFHPVKNIKQLTWNDFSGLPELTSPYDACLRWGIYYTYKLNDSTGMIHLDVKVEPESSSWFRKGKETKELLVHERGHYSIASIYGNLFKNKVDSYKFSIHRKVDLEISKIFEEIFNECVDLQELYDMETNHSLDKVQQSRWNEILQLNLL